MHVRSAFSSPGALALGGLAALSAAGMLGAYQFDVVRHRVPLSGLKTPLRVVQLTDLHYGLFVRRASVQAWVDATLAQQPDLIVITGDFVDSRAGDGRPQLLRALASLRAPLGVWAVWGNHDYRRLGARLPEFEAQLKLIGVRVLTNAGASLRDDFFLAGVDDLIWGKPDVSAALGNRPARAATLLLAHHPRVLLDVPQDVGLTLCGHTHGGQIRLPGLRWLYRRTSIGAQYLDGFVEAPARGYISRGLGVTWLPMRLGSRAELSVFDLTPVAQA